MPALNFGKILAVKSDSTKTASNVKKLTNSKTAVEHKLNNRTKDDVRDFFKCILNAYEMLSGIRSDHLENFKFYEVDKNAISTMYRLADDKFHSTLQITKTEYEELKLLVDAMTAIGRAKHFYTVGLKQHEFLTNHLKRTKVKSSLVKNCDADLKSAMNNLDSVANEIAVRMEQILNKTW